MKNKLFQYFSLIAANPASKLSKKQKSEPGHTQVENKQTLNKYPFSC